MKVFVAGTQGDETFGIFSSEEKALEILKKEKPKSYHQYQIIQFDLDVPKDQNQKNI